MTPNTSTVRALTTGRGTPYRWQRWPTNVVGSAEIRVDDEPRAYGRGSIPGADWSGGRTVVHELTVSALDRDEALQRADELEAAFAPADVDEWLVVDIEGHEFHFRGRCRGVEIPLGRRFLSGSFVARAEFRATDPLAYGPEQSIVIHLDDPGAGFVLPIVLPAVLGGTPGGGEATIVNTGNQPATWVAVFDGPLINPRLTQGGTGRAVRVLTEIAGGQSVAVDSDVAAVLIGSAVRNDLLGPGASWFDLPPGTSSVHFTADSGSGTATITWRSGSA